MIRYGIVLSGLLLCVTTVEAQRAGARPQTAAHSFVVSAIQLYPFEGQVNQGVLNVAFGPVVAAGEPADPIPHLVVLDIQQVSPDNTPVWDDEITVSLVELHDQEPPTVLEKRTMGVMSVLVGPNRYPQRGYVPMIIYGLGGRCGDIEIRAAITPARGAPAREQPRFRFQVFDCGD